MNISVDELAQEIRRVDGSNSLGAGALAEALMPFLSKQLSEALVLEIGPVDFPYQRTFNAIADAVTWAPDKTFGISVDAFQQSFNSYAIASHSNNLAEVEESLAKALARSDGENPDADWFNAIDQQNPKMWQRYLPLARTAMTSLRPQGLRAAGSDNVTILVTKAQRDAALSSGKKLNDWISGVLEHAVAQTANERKGWDHRYRPLSEGEIILATDEVQHDDGTWHLTIGVGKPAPSPSYSSHRVYRRLIRRRDGQARPVHIVRATGTIDQQRKTILQSETYKRGDTVLCWVNEGDLYANPSVVFEDLTALATHDRKTGSGGQSFGVATVNDLHFVTIDSRLVGEGFTSYEAADEERIRLYLAAYDEDRTQDKGEVWFKHEGGPNPAPGKHVDIKIAFVSADDVDADIFDWNGPCFWRIHTGEK